MALILDEIWLVSAFASALLLLAMLFALLWCWVVRHEMAIEQLWRRVLHRPRIAQWRIQYAQQIAFMHARLSPDRYLGLQLTTGALFLIGASWLFGGIAEDVVTGAPINIVDALIAEWFHNHATPCLTVAMTFFTNLHGTVPVTIAVLITGTYLTWKRRSFWLTSFVLTVPFGMLLNVLMKYAFHRARPDFTNPLLLQFNYSFPSGHVAGATLFYGFLAVLLISHIAAWRWRVTIVLTAITLIALVGLTRMYLGVHYLSDVLAAFAEGVGWLSLVLASVDTWSRHHKKHPE